MEIRFTFTEWLTLINPNCRLRITTEECFVYQSKNRDGMSFDMDLIGFDLSNLKKN